MAFKPKKKKKEEEQEQGEEEQEEQEEEEQEEEQKKPNQITKQEVRDIIEGHLNRATELFRQYM